MVTYLIRSGDLLVKFFLHISIDISYISMWEHVPNRTGERSGLFLALRLRRKFLSFGMKFSTHEMFLHFKNSLIRRNILTCQF